MNMQYKIELIRGFVNKRGPVEDPQKTRKPYLVGWMSDSVIRHFTLLLVNTLGWMAECAIAFPPYAKRAPKSQLFILNKQGGQVNPPFQNLSNVIETK